MSDAVPQPPRGRGGGGARPAILAGVTTLFILFAFAVWLVVWAFTTAGL